MLYFMKDYQAGEILFLHQSNSRSMVPAVSMSLYTLKQKKQRVISRVKITLPHLVINGSVYRQYPETTDCIARDQMANLQFSNIDINSYVSSVHEDQ